MILRRVPVFCLALLVLGGLTTRQAEAQTEEDAILKAVGSVFEGINTKDRDLILSVMAENSVLFATGKRDDISFARPSTGAQFAQQVSAGDRKFLERMFETQVRFQEGVATVWANYDFHVDGTFSHCGVDTFTLVKTAGGWKVASLVYTVETEGCAERPAVSSQ